MMILRLILISAIFLWFPGAFRRWTHGFRLAKCAVAIPYNPAWEVSDPDPWVKDLLKEPFTYLDKGAQSFVFLSADKKHVLKLFRFDACRIPFGQQCVRKARKLFGLSEKHYVPFPEKAQRTFNSCMLAYETAPHLTGIVWVHLNTGPTDLPIFKIKDRLGRTHRIDPTKYRFVIQKKAEPFLSTIEKATDPAPLIESFLQLIEQVSKLGLANLDPTMAKNFGFIDGKAVEIDFGDFSLDPDLAREGPKNFSRRLFKWLRKHRPDLSAYVAEKEGT